MAQPLVTALRDLQDKIASLADVRKDLLARISALEQENISLKEELEETRTKLHNCETDVKFLTMSHRLAQSPDAVINARRHIARLIRNIDKCISMLKEEE